MTQWHNDETTRVRISEEVVVDTLNHRRVTGDWQLLLKIKVWDRKNLLQNKRSVMGLRKDIPFFKMVDDGKRLDT